MYFVGNEFNADNGGYKTLAQAKKQAEKKNMKVFDTDGTVVWPEAAAEEATAGAEPEETEAGVNNPGETENAGNGENNEGEAGENNEGEEATAGAAFVVGTVEVIYKGMIALRNAPKWSDGHKCGIAKTGFKADVVEKAVVKGHPLYKLANGKWISGKPEHVKFTAAE